MTQSLQMQSVRNHFESAAQDQDLMARTGHLHWIVAEIIKFWQDRAAGDDPTDYHLSFRTPQVTATLRQVLTLVPEEYQDLIKLENSGDLAESYDLESWLEESLMNVLVDICVPEAAPGAHFALCLAENCNTGLDHLAASKEGFKSWLEYLKDEQERDQPNWNAGGIYTVPTDTDRIVCFWNYYGNHWAVVSIDVNSRSWKYNVYDSLGSPDTIHSITRLGVHLGHLICLASGIEKPTKLPVIISQPTAQQDNVVDCGVFAVDNATHLLKKEPVEEHIDPFKRRVGFLRKILHALREGRGVNPKPKPSVKKEDSIDGQGSDSNTSKVANEKRDSVEGRDSDSNPSKLSPSQKDVGGEKSVNHGISNPSTGEQHVSGGGAADGSSELFLGEEYVSTQLSISDSSCFWDATFNFLNEPSSCKASAHPKLEPVLILYSGRVL